MNVSLARLHVNKPTGTHGLTPTPAYFDIVPALTITAKSQKNVFILICGCWKCSHHICINSECLCSNAFPLYEQQNNNFIFMCTNKLEYISCHFLPEKGGVQISRVYELLEILWYLRFEMCKVHELM